MKVIVPLVLFLTSIYGTSLPKTSEVPTTPKGSLRNKERTLNKGCPDAQLFDFFTKAKKEGKLVYDSNHVTLSLSPKVVDDFVSKNKVFFFEKQEFSYQLASWYKSTKSLTYSSIKVRLSFQGEQTKLYNGSYDYTLNLDRLTKFEDLHDNKYHIVLGDEVAYPFAVYFLLTDLDKKTPDWDKKLVDSCKEEKEYNELTWFCKNILENEKDIRSIPKRLVFHPDGRVHGDC